MDKFTIDHLIKEHQLILMVLSGVGALIVKWVWDRWLSQGSRVTRLDCSLIREKCQSEIMGLVKQHSSQLCEGDETFESMSKTMMVMLLVLLKMCEKQNINCDDIRKAMIQKGLID